MSDETRASNKAFEEALEKYKAELKRREELRVEKEQENEQYKKEAILDLYQKLKDTGFPEKLIPSRLVELLLGYVSKKHIYKTLEHLTSRILSPNSNRLQNDDKKEIEESSISQEEQKKKLLIGNDGQILNEETVTEDPEQQNPVSQIFNGKSEEQMKREADNEVDEDMEETQENPRNSNLITDIPEDLRSKLAQFDEIKQALEHVTEEKDSYKDLYEKNRKLSPRLLMTENAELKTKNRQLETILNTSNEEVKKEFSYEFLEVRKLSALRDQQIRMTSANSEKTFFLWINPKTQEVLDVKTDKEHHRIEAIRKREKESQSQQGAEVA
ncbi:MAG: hypothetical protein L0H53_00490 [Candidatus Nitrosocosmicus sp.]|nr:hypothetical protein [Candidatus Nitrosocosmicus sp.]MDN5866014.1 hypothetical protein [Candidatus Nitrosocosmicus sp.]